MISTWAFKVKASQDDCAGSFNPQLSSFDYEPASRSCSLGPTDSAFRGRGDCLTVCGLNLFDRYLLREWLKMLGLLLAATTGVLMMSALYDNFRDLIQLKAGVDDILSYYLT